MCPVRRDRTRRGHWQTLRVTTVLLMLGALVVVLGVAALATREGSAMAPAQPDRPDVVLRDGATGTDVRAVRFPLAPGR